MLPIHVALVAEESKISMAELSEVAAALQKQVMRDFAPLWHVQADVTAFARLEDLPLDYWPIIIRDDIKNDSAVGYHTDDHGQPFSLVKYADDWPLTSSHEALEMLADPFGRRMIAGLSPVKGQGRVKFLVEVCDPCEGIEFAYAINGVTVSDFFTPHYFDPVTNKGVRYSFNDSLSAPRQVRKDGYLSWFAPHGGEWWQRNWFGPELNDKQLTGLQVRNGDVRAAIDRVTAPERVRAMSAARPLAAAKEAGLAGGAHESYGARAASLRASIDAAIG